MRIQRGFSFLVLSGCAGGCFLAAAMAWRTSRHIQVAPLRQTLMVGALLLAGLVLLVSLRLPQSARVTLSMTLLSLVVAAYTAEIYLTNLPQIRARQAAMRLAVPYDSRSQVEVVRDLRQRGIQAYPAVFPSWEGLDLEKGSLLPLSGIAEVTTVFCNEYGPRIVYLSDERGFRNPPGVWSHAPDLAVVGDSFAQGACVPDGAGFVDLFRRQFPGTVNTGMLGNGPLLDLAELKEYLVPLEPRIVLWVFTEGNDLDDLDREKGFPQLMDYLTAGHQQGLASRREEAEALLRDPIDKVYAERLSRGTAPSIRASFWRLWSLRQALGLGLKKKTDAASTANFQLLRDVLSEARRSVHAWGGEIRIVYLPALERYLGERYKKDADSTRDHVLSIARDLELPVIDLDPTIARSPHEYYLYPGAHFSPSGNRAVAETILKALHP